MPTHYVGLTSYLQSAKVKKMEIMIALCYASHAVQGAPQKTRNIFREKF